MGYFTWTDASKQPRKTKSGDWRKSDIIQYGEFAKIVLPDNTWIPVYRYDGYGRFGEYEEIDVYDVVVDMNKQHLKEIMDGMLKRHPNGFWGAELYDIACAYADDDEDGFEKAIGNRLSKEPTYLHLLREEWKRLLGIAVSCEDDDNDALPYPLKVTARRDFVKYADLHPSYTTQ